MIMQQESYNNQDVQPVTLLSLGIFSNVKTIESIYHYFYNEPNVNVKVFNDNSFELRFKYRFFCFIEV